MTRGSSATCTTSGKSKSRNFRREEGIGEKVAVKQNVGKIRFGLKELDALTESELKGLRVRNISPNAVAVDGKREGAGEIVLAPHEETIVGAQQWRAVRFFREAVTGGKLEIAVADVYDTPRQLPNLDAAPEPTETIYDKNYAQHILTTNDENEALDMVREQSFNEDTTLNVRFMKTRKHKILKVVEWAEPQLQNRKRVLTAVREELGKIRDL